MTKTPKASKTNTSQKVTTIALDPEVHAEVKRIADFEERDFGAQIRIIVRDWLATRTTSERNPETDEEIEKWEKGEAE